MVDAGADRVFRIGSDRAVSIAVESERLAKPNGIAWDARERRFVVVPFGGDTLMTWRPAAVRLDVNRSALSLGRRLPS